MSRFAHEYPDDHEAAMERLIDRADHARKEKRENPPVPKARQILTEKCPACGRDFPNGGTCIKGGCPMGGDF